MAMLSSLHPQSRLFISLLKSPLKVEHRQFAKTILGALTGKSKVMAGAFEKKKRLPVETDPHKLVNYCCGSNIYKEGEDVKLKEDSEYPDWLWNLRLEPPELEDLDPNTKEYWEHYFMLQRVHEFRMRQRKTKPKFRVNEQDAIYKLKQLRFRALAYKYDPGYDTPPKFDKDNWRII